MIIKYTPFGRTGTLSLALHDLDVTRKRGGQPPVRQ